MFLPPVLRPLATAGPVNAAAQRISEAPFSVVRGVRGSYVAERLAGVIDDWERLQDCVWLRARDCRPAELAQSLAVACRHRWSSGAGTDIRAASGAQLSGEIRAAPEGAVIVIELGGRVTMEVARLASAIRSAAIDRGVSVLVVAESRFHPPSGRAPDWAAPASDLFGPHVLDDYPCAWNRGRLLSYAGRRAAVVHDVLAAGQLWSQDVVAEALDAAHGLPSFLDRLTALLLGQLTPDQRNALEVALVTGYWHPQLGTRPVAAEQLRPWLVPLERQWGWLRPIWASPLRRELARSASAGQGVNPARAVHAVAAPGGRTVPAARAAAQPGLLQARLFGSLEVRVDGTAVTSWNGQRGASVLRYLLFRSQHACSRDELLEEYWPTAPAGAAARNRLQVAVSALRRAFSDVTTLNVVEYADGGYRISRDLRVEVDVERFELGLRTARAAERSGDREQARTAYQEAVALYRDDFAADAPFEQWTLLPRESLRIKLVDALDRLSRLELADRRIDDCIATAHRMLDVDPCREDAHRLLMLVQRVRRDVERGGVVRDCRVSRNGVVAGEQDLRATAEGLGEQLDVPIAAKGGQPERPERAADFPGHADLEWLAAVQNVVPHLEARERRGGVDDYHGGDVASDEAWHVRVELLHGNSLLPWTAPWVGVVTRERLCSSPEPAATVPLSGSAQPFLSGKCLVSR